MIRPTLIAIAFLSIAAPALAQITDDQLATLKVGSTTLADVEAKFGHPMTVEKSSDGSETLTYTTTKTHIKGASFVPIMGLFAGGSKADVTTDRFDFDKDGVLTKVWSSQTKVDCSMMANCQGR